MPPHARALDLPSSALAATGRIYTLRVLARIIGVGAVLTILALVLTPWQQSVRGSGRVIAYAPLDRQQAIETPIDGRVIEWYVQEGDRVERGDPIAELSDNDPEILGRLEREREAAAEQIHATELSIALTEAQVVSLDAAADAAVANAGLRVQMATDRRDAATRAVDAAKATYKTAELNLSRQTNLHERGLASKRDLELAELDRETSHTNLDRSQAELRAAKAEVRALVAERARVASTNQASVDATRTALERLKVELAKSKGELARVEVRLARQQQMKVIASRDGTILRIIAKQDTEMVKAGDPLAILVPDTNSAAVELYVDGHDAPLVDKGRHVRLQFEGWPALQFVGWPSVAVGTFGGTVAFIDAHDDGHGRFRMVIIPDNDDPWPSARYLRQGVRANGWVLLDQVPLGFELWRQFNGFPPSIDPEDKTSAPKRKVRK